MTPDDFVRQVGMLLRDVPCATTADLTDGIVAYWNGYAVVFAFLCDSGRGAVDEEFDLDDYVWEDWRAEFEQWSREPVFSVRPEVLQWLKDAPPRESGA